MDDNAPVPFSVRTIDPIASHLTYPFRCRACGREFPLRKDTFDERAWILMTNGVSIWDLSARWPTVTE